MAICYKAMRGEKKKKMTGYHENLGFYQQTKNNHCYAALGQSLANKLLFFSNHFWEVGTIFLYNVTACVTFYDLVLLSFFSLKY